ncbi:histidine phosphatase family protein [Alteribacillus sp. YIM 98480]|uniref:histidine phosphatase family protein n=1 Tax=Alteribacillus sp. YIM 98480 TaxID=2606599 RepID=UPI00131C9CA7|nr:histidine phosphatase family protein [Alteribacillus sp. YIM 98480]
MVEQRIVYFLRHGMTSSNFHKQYCGWSNPPLLKSEVERLKCYAWRVLVDEVWCSDLLRAVHTADLLFPNASLRSIKSLREIHFGDFEGKTYKELKENSEYQAWLEDFFHTAPKNGESLTAFRKRIQYGWEKVTQSKQKSIAVVTHSGWIREWCRLYISESKANCLWNIPYGGGVAARFEMKGGDWHCISLQEVRLTEKKDGF